MAPRDADPNAAMGDGRKFRNIFTFLEKSAIIRKSALDLGLFGIGKAHAARSETKRRSTH
jgi:hypothetical protein